MDEVTTVKVDVLVDGKKIPINMAFGFEDVMDLDGDEATPDEPIRLWVGQGLVGMTEMWIL